MSKQKNTVYFSRTYTMYYDDCVNETRMCLIDCYHHLNIGHVLCAGSLVRNWCNWATDLSCGWANAYTIVINKIRVDWAMKKETMNTWKCVTDFGWPQRSDKDKNYRAKYRFTNRRDMTTHFFSISSKTHNINKNAIIFFNAKTFCV